MAVDAVQHPQNGLTDFHVMFLYICRDVYTYRAGCAEHRGAAMLEAPIDSLKGATLTNGARVTIAHGIEMPLYI